MHCMRSWMHSFGTRRLKKAAAFGSIAPRETMSQFAIEFIPIAQ